MIFMVGSGMAMVWIMVSRSAFIKTLPMDVFEMDDIWQYLVLLVGIRYFILCGDCGSVVGQFVGIIS